MAERRHPQPTATWSALGTHLNSVAGQTDSTYITILELIFLHNNPLEVVEEGAVVVPLCSP